MSKGGMRQSSRVRSESFASLHFGQNQRSLPNFVVLVKVSKSSLNEQSN